MSKVARARPLCVRLIAFALIATLASCSPGNAQTDKVATTVADAISSPRQGSADGLVRAALGATENQDFTVLEAEDLDADKIDDPLARLVFRVHLPATLSGFISADPVTACYEAEFNYYGVIGSPDRIRCPAGARAIVPPPIAPKPKIVIPQGFDSTLAELLAALPPRPSEEYVMAQVTEGLPVPAINPESGLQDLPPVVETAVIGADVGVSLREPDTRDCLLGTRLGGQVKVGRPSRVQLQPGELSCDPQTAFRLFSADQS